MDQQAIIITTRLDRFSTGQFSVDPKTNKKRLEKVCFDSAKAYRRWQKMVEAGNYAAE